MKVNAHNYSLIVALLRELREIAQEEVVRICRQ